MQKISAIIASVMLLSVSGLSAQTVDCNALKNFSPATVRATYEICRCVKLSPEQQMKLAKEIDGLNEAYTAAIEKEGGLLSVNDSRKLDKAHDKMLAGILSEDQLAQYYRGVYDKEANAEGIRIADNLQKRYNLTDQNWKFIRIAFYKIGLDSRVIKKLMADNPKKAKKEIARLRDEQLMTIEEKGGIRVNPEGTTVTFIREFNPNALRKE